MTVDEVLERIVILEYDGNPWVDTGCWRGPESRSGNDYRSVYLGGGRKNPKHEYVHRLVYKVLRGEIPDGFDLHHVCRNTWCCNPDHLETLSRKDHNHLNPLIIDQIKRTHCPLGHPYNSETIRMRQGHRSCKPCEYERSKRRREQQHGGNSKRGGKLKAEQVLEIRRLHAAGASYNDLACAFRVTDVTIGQIVRRVTWQRLTGEPSRE